MESWNNNTSKNIMKFKQIPIYHQKRKKIKYKTYLKTQNLKQNKVN